MKHCFKINCCDELGQIKSQETLQTLVWPTDPLGCTIHEIKMFPVTINKYFPTINTCLFTPKANVSLHTKIQ